jgi:hypothetical protein
MGRRAQIHANFLQQPPIAILSLFKGLTVARVTEAHFRVSPLASWPGSSAIHAVLPEWRSRLFLCNSLKKLVFLMPIRNL